MHERILLRVSPAASCVAAATTLCDERTTPQRSPGVEYESDFAILCGAGNFAGFISVSPCRNIALDGDDS